MKCKIYGETDMGIPYVVINTKPLISFDEDKAIVVTMKVGEKIKKKLEKLGDKVKLIEI